MTSSDTFTFDPDTHQYWVGGEKVLSVTQILKTCGLIDDTWYTEKGRQRGQAVHLATQLYDEDYITKPVKLKDLKTKVEKVLGRFAG